MNEEEAFCLPPKLRCAGDVPSGKIGNAGDCRGDETNGESSSSGESVKLTSEDDDAAEAEALLKPLLLPPARFSKDNERIEEVSDCVEYDVER